MSSQILITSLDAITLHLREFGAEDQLFYSRTNQLSLCCYFKERKMSVVPKSAVGLIDFSKLQIRPDSFD